MVLRYQILISFLFLLFSKSCLGQNLAAVNLGSVEIKHYNFSKIDKEAHMWSAMYIASNNKIYIGLCTHADAATVYEFDIETETMRQLANLTELLGERGRAIWTNGKIHVRMQELDGYVYFGPQMVSNSYGYRKS